MEHEPCVREAQLFMRQAPRNLFHYIACHSESAVLTSMRSKRKRIRRQKATHTNTHPCKKYDRTQCFVQVLLMGRGADLHVALRACTMAVVGRDCCRRWCGAQNDKDVTTPYVQ